MTLEQGSSLLAILAAVVVTSASYRHWVDVTYDGGTPLRRWAKLMLAGVIALLLGAMLLLILSTLD